MPTVTSNGTVVVRRNPVDWITGALAVIGAINWGLVGLAHFDLVAAIFGAGSARRTDRLYLGGSGWSVLAHSSICPEP
ncbi:DUF378 domain-containing protein [Caballeronia sp. LZ001]|uniref:DUF378 domain-containing protein n=1 Tax=Caballeronia sp. LZ001 TaxID=3038553 RepID=UPI0028542AB4|nr:DUF378 domain-containing protein [Caballeronia sp. LZ001]MDR5798869.1 DUF378 domain-containing protein [Caballeronia sp. LZ001]